MQDTGQVLVIDDGRLGGLLATLLVQDRALVGTAVAPASAPGADEARPARLRALQRRAELLGLGAVHELPATGWSSGPLNTAGTILAAAALAIDLHATRLVWPAHFGDDLDSLACASDRLRLLDALIGVEAPALSIESPFIDLTDAQLADLALDLDAPLAGAHWCDRNEPGPCGRCASCRAWTPLLERARALA